MARVDSTVLEGLRQETVVRVNRVAKVVKGGKRFSFAALVVVGNGHGYVGCGLGKATEVPEAIRKGMEDAKKNLFPVPLVGNTIPHEINVKFGSAQVMLKPASQGTGVIAGGAVRAVVEAAGIKDILQQVAGVRQSHQHRLCHRQGAEVAEAGVGRGGAAWRKSVEEIFQ